jgi:hypothetical protein
MRRPGPKRMSSRKSVLDLPVSFTLFVNHSGEALR